MNTWGIYSADIRSKAESENIATQSDLKIILNILSFLMAVYIYIYIFIHHIFFIHRPALQLFLHLGYCK